MAKKEKELKNDFQFNGEDTNYNFQLKKKPNLWWLLLLLLPLVLLIPLRKNIVVETRVNGNPEPYVDVSMHYMARYLLWNWQWLPQAPYDLIQQTDEHGRTVFRHLGYSVYSRLFHPATTIEFAVPEGDCYEPTSVTCRFFRTRKVVLDLTPKVTEVKLRVIDRDEGFSLPGATVECEYQGRDGMQHFVGIADYDGCVVIPDALACNGVFSTIQGSADGYADTILTDRPVEELLAAADGYPVPLRRLADPNPPEKNCGVHFSGAVLSDAEVPGVRVIFGNDPSGEYVGNGYYPQNTEAFPKAVRTTFDAIAVDQGTHLILYSEPYFEGEVLLDVVGPILITNVKWINDTRYNFVATKTFTPELQELFPPERRQWSSSNMHDWSTGSCRIICEE